MSYTPINWQTGDTIMLCVSGTTTHQEMNKAFSEGKLMFFRPYAGTKSYRIITSVGSDAVGFIPTDSNIQTSFVDDVFTVQIQA